MPRGRRGGRGRGAQRDGHGGTPVRGWVATAAPQTVRTDDGNNAVAAAPAAPPSDAARGDSALDPLFQSCVVVTTDDTAGVDGDKAEAGTDGKTAAAEPATATASHTYEYQLIVTFKPPARNFAAAMFSEPDENALLREALKAIQAGHYVLRKNFQQAQEINRPFVIKAADARLDGEHTVAIFKISAARGLKNLPTIHVPQSVFYAEPMHGDREHVAFQHLPLSEIVDILAVKLTSATETRELNTEFAFDHTLEGEAEKLGNELFVAYYKCLPYSHDLAGKFIDMYSRCLSDGHQNAAPTEELRQANVTGPQALSDKLGEAGFRERFTGGTRSNALLDILQTQVTRHLDAEKNPYAKAAHQKAIEAQYTVDSGAGVALDGPPI
jgi:hypothetical protein